MESMVRRIVQALADGQLPELKCHKKTKRFVFHVDMDCFFANVALRKFPQHRNDPVVISHHGGKLAGEPTEGESFKKSTSECATCNYEARKYGIKKGMYLGRAKEL